MYMYIAYSTVLEQSTRIFYQLPVHVIQVCIFTLFTAECQNSYVPGRNHIQHVELVTYNYLKIV